MIDAYQQGRPAPAIERTTVGTSQPAVAGHSAAPKLGPAAQATAGTTTAPTVASTTIDQTQSNQTRGQQEQSLSDLFAASRGLTPSAAELEFRKNADRNVANQYAMAAALQGRSAGGALKQASDAAGDINARAAADASILHAKETEAARQALSLALQGVRTSDITAAGDQGRLDSAQALKQGDLSSIAGVTNANNTTTVNTTNAQQTNDVAKYGAGLENATGIANANNDTSASNTNANNSTTLVGKQADIDAQRAQNDVINQLKARGLDDEQIGRYLQAITTGRGQDIQAGTAARGQDLQFQSDAARNATARELGISDIALRSAVADWNKTKDITTLTSSLLTAGASNSAVQKLISGLTSGGADGYPGTEPYTPGVDYGYSGNNSADTTGSVSGNGNYGPESDDNPYGTG